MVIITKGVSVSKSLFTKLPEYSFMVIEATQQDAIERTRKAIERIKDRGFELLTPFKINEIPMSKGTLFAFELRRVS